MLETQSAGDLSLKMFSILATGVALWAVYGFLQQDMVIIAANVVSLCFLAGILYFKLREKRGTATRLLSSGNDNCRFAREATVIGV